MRDCFCVLAAALLALAPSLAVAEDFTFKRVKVADILPGKRITVQIDPEAQARYLAALPKVDPNPVRDPQPPGAAVPGPQAAPKSTYAWFWETVPPALGDGADRFDRALTALAQGPVGQVVPAPRLQTMQALATTYGREILAATVGTNVSPALVLAVIGIESGGDPKAVSTAGAVGLMQLIPATATRFGVTDSTDPRQNITGGVAYLDWLLDEFDNDPLMVLAAYNAGEGAVRDNGGVPPYVETRDYVPKVLAAWQVAQGLCLTRPELVTDPCVFTAIATGG